MECRLHDNHYAVGACAKFNINALSEVFAVIDGEYLDMFINELDVFVTAKKEWIHLPDAFKNKDVITDNFNTNFFEPKNEEDKNRGYTI